VVTDGLDARATFERALAIAQAAYGPDHLNVARILGNLGMVQRELGELSEARATFERALAIFEAAYGPDDPDLARTLDNLDNIKEQMDDQ
jgi:tetratricopeptide (TPR) repeat protein